MLEIPWKISLKYFYQIYFEENKTSKLTFERLLCTTTECRLVAEMLRIKTDDDQEHGTVLIDVKSLSIKSLLIFSFSSDFEIIRTKI